MNILFYYRNKNAGYSIGAVFDTIVTELKKVHQVKCSYLPSPYADIQSIFKNGWFARKEERNDYINHITGDVHYLLWFLKGRRTIVTVHDIMYYHYLKGLKKKLWKLLYIVPLKKAAYVTFISEFAYRQVKAVIELDPKRVRVIPNPVDNSFKYSPKEFNLQKPIILHIGTLARKNLLRTIEALKGINCHLRIIGELDAKALEALKRNKIEYSNSFHLSHEDIIREYRNADIINFPSLFEGFGMPIIEGQATGRIVITSHISPMKEVAGKGAVIVDPYSVEDIRNAYLAVIQNKDLRENMLHEGLKNVENYRADKITGQYANLYKELYENID
ncbi:glycosyltransferase family 4 protein [Prevotella sp. HCN-7019]|uniref:glycosyltransferase family 4 protein n=1 Tax=Prevotella sp. HCN-7019 TaxID=3134668 RepID=UPI0030C296BB